MAKEREPLPWTKLNYDHLLDDPAVVCMSNEQLGGYLKLLRAAWKAATPGHLPNDHAYLSTVSGLAPWSSHQQTIERAFDCSDPAYLVQRRIVREYEAAGRMHEVKRASAMQRWSGSNASAMHPQCIRSERERGELEGDLEKDKTNTLVQASPERPSAKARLDDWMEAFPEFWDEYPRKVAKEAARRAYSKIEPKTQATCDLIFKGLGHYAKNVWATRPPDKIEHASTWLNQRRFTDAAEA